MSVIAAKYIPSVGWCGVKNRDRTYKPFVRLRRSFRKSVERLYLWDDATKYTEGLNEYGVSIISAGISVEKDEREAIKALHKHQSPVPRRYYSPEGLRIRTALYETNVESALGVLIDMQVPGSTLVFDKNTCYILEGSYVADPDRFVYEYRAVSTANSVVRTNHGHLLPWLGVGVDDEGSLRRSSEERLRRVIEDISWTKTPIEVLEAISSTSNPDVQLNPLRIDNRRGAVRTTGQLLLIPSQLALYYRPIWCDVRFKFEDLSSAKSKTTFEVLSTKRLTPFTQYQAA